MPPSRPVSARRSGNNDEPEKAVLHTYLLPRNIAEAKARSRAALSEVLGSILVQPGQPPPQRHSCQPFRPSPDAEPTSSVSRTRKRKGPHPHSPTFFTRLPLEMATLWLRWHPEDGMNPHRRTQILPGSLSALVQTLSRVLESLQPCHGKDQVPASPRRAVGPQTSPHRISHSSPSDTEDLALSLSIWAHQLGEQHLVQIGRVDGTYRIFIVNTRRDKIASLVLWNVHH